jgi:hypothetical protein
MMDYISLPLQKKKLPALRGPADSLTKTLQGFSYRNLVADTLNFMLKSAVIR